MRRVFASCPSVLPALSRSAASSGARPGSRAWACFSSALRSSSSAVETSCCASNAICCARVLSLLPRPCFARASSCARACASRCCILRISSSASSGMGQGYTAGVAVWITGARDRQALCVEGGRIIEEASRPPAGSETLDAKGLWLVPALIDAHVHMSLVPGAPRALLRAGIAAVLDLGAPERELPFREADPLRVRFSGPLLTAPRGYPTQSWGRDGYGLEIATAAE